jgi:DNA repair exonuclease SbcCD nuclease subunit
MLTMKVAVVGDPHFKTSDYDECEEMSNAIIDVISKVKPDLIVCLGDTLDRFESIHVSPLRQATNFIKRLTEIQQTVLLIGNHDRPNPKTFKSDEHPFTALKLWENLIVCDDTLFSDFPCGRFVFVPYTFNGNFHKMFSKVPLQENIKVIATFTHQEFRGVKMNGIPSESDDVVIPSYGLTINGHIHDYQQHSNLICVGTPRQISFNEEYPKTISIFDFTPNDYTHERLPLQISQKITLTLPVKDVLGYQAPPNSKVKLIAEGTFDEIKALMKLKGAKPNVKLQYKIVDISSSSNNIKTSIEKKSFREYLHDKIKGTDVENVYNELFT